MNHWEWIVFDLDDTLCKTKWIFHQQIINCSKYLSKKIGGNNNDWCLKLEQVNNRLFETFKVNPKRWVEVVNLTVGDADQNIKDGAVEIFKEIYTTPLPFIDGAEECLIKLKKTNANMAIHTHANEKWTWRKYEWLKLDRFFSKKQIFITGEDDHKTAKSWTRVFRQLNCNPELGMVIGDSPRSDINPAIEIGVGKCVLFEGEEIWSVHQRELPNSVIRIKNLKEILQL